ncbi:MAG: DNA-directed RNA polymerase subunit alpha [Candidatus Nealsonbacteria bacterium]|nr:DNA-directed RNA polymerase subunit alpha [Candidatus Nealsonbacteria bacterium]
MISLPTTPKITEKKGNFAKIEIEGLYPGYGVTVGNTLRRVLLSSLPGAAVVQAKIKGVQHEFSTISGVLEDVVNILLNLKQLRFKLYTDEPQMVVLKIRGVKEVKGSDIELPGQVELVNKDAHIATITDKKKELDMELLVAKGLGYEPVERRKREKLQIGVIALDAIFTPVRKVSYKVENMRVGERTDFDRLSLELETDGTISPEEAFFKASEILVKHFSLFEEAFKSALEVKSFAVEKTRQKTKKHLVKQGKITVKKHEKRKKGKKIK